MKTAFAIRFRAGEEEFELSVPSSVVQHCSVGNPATEEVRTLLASTLDAPLAFPPLSSAYLEEDLVAIAVEDSVPQGEAVVTALVDYLVEHGHSREQIKVVLNSVNPQAIAKFRFSLDTSGHELVPLVSHLPREHNHLEYVAAAESADAIYVQRDLVEAALVIPIYCVRHEDSPQASDKYGIAPSFADAQTQHRWNLAWLEDHQDRLHRQRKLSQETGWLLGIQFTIAVVPAKQGDIVAILSGAPDAVYAEAIRRMEQATAPENAANQDSFDMAIAIIEGDRAQQTWMNVARAIAHIESQLSPSGRIVVCCGLNTLTSGISQLASDDPDESVQKRLLKSDYEDAFAAAIIRDAQSRRSIYLWSQLSASQVESIGLAFVDSIEDVQRLAQSVQQVYLLRSAQFQ